MRKVEFECECCGDTGENSYRKNWPEGIKKIKLDRCARCRKSGDPLPAVIFEDAEGKELK